MTDAEDTLSRAQEMAREVRRQLQPISMHVIDARRRVQYTSNGGNHDIREAVDTMTTKLENAEDALEEVLDLLETFVEHGTIDPISDDYED